MSAARLQALSFTMYILVFVLCEGYVVGYVRNKRQIVVALKMEEDLQKSKRLQDNALHSKNFGTSGVWCIAGCILFFAAASVLTIIPDPDYFAMSSAMTDLTNGSAKAYGDAMAERTELYNSGEKNIVVQPLPAKPALIYFSDIDEDPEYWENRGLCKYYGLESVRVKE